MATSEPARAGPRARLLRYAYSNKNLVGCVGALAGLGLFFTGVVGDLWPLVVAGLYGAGALATPSPRRIELHNLHAGLDAASLERAMAEQARRIRGRVPDEVAAGVARIHDTIREIVARRAGLPPGSPDAFVVERTALDYLPTALEAYMALPRAYANRVRVSQGRTSLDVLNAQLELLSDRLRQVLDALVKGDTDRLLAHERFLADRFGQSELDLGQR